MQRLQLLLYNLNVQSQTEGSGTCSYWFWNIQGLVKELDGDDHCLQGPHTMECGSVFVNKDFLGRTTIAQLSGHDRDRVTCKIKIIF